MTKNINRLKVVLAEKNRTNKWLAEQLGKDPGTISKWCTNTMQPNLETLVEIAKILEDGTSTLDDSLKLYEEGIKLADFCKNKLNDAKQKITDLNEVKTDD